MEGNIFTQPGPRPEQLFTSSPYSEAKAGSDLLVLSYHTTYKLPVLVARASNNYSPCQFAGKLIPLMITNARDNRALPVCGDGMQVGLRTIAGRLSLY